MTERVRSQMQASEQGHREGGQGGTMTPGPMGFSKPVGFSGPSRGRMSSRGDHRNDTEKSECEAWRPFFFGNHLFSTEKTVRISVKTFFLFFWRSQHNSDKNAAISSSVLEFTKPEIRHIWAGPVPTFGSRRPCVRNEVFEKNRRSYTI